MSLIYDKDLIANLLKLAQVAPVANPTVDADFKNYVSLTQKLVNKLQQSKGFKEADSTGTSSKGDASMTVADLNTFGNFLNFIVNNEIMVSGKRVAFSARENPQDKTYLPVNGELSNDMETMQNGQRVAPVGEYYVNKDLLVKYVGTLLEQVAKEDARSQTFIKVMLNGILEKINQKFQTKLTTDVAPTALKDDKKVQTDVTETSGITQDLNNKSIQNKQQDINEFANDLPLDREDIDFVRIREYFTTVKNHLSSFGGEHARIPEIQNNMNIAEATMSKASALTKASVTKIDLNSSWADIRDMLKPQAVPTYTLFLNELENIVNSTAAVVSGIYSMYVRSDRGKQTFTETARGSIEAQFLGSNSIKTQNLQILQGLENNANKVTQLK